MARVDHFDSLQVHSRCHDVFLNIRADFGWLDVQRFPDPDGEEVCAVIIDDSGVTHFVICMHEEMLGDFEGEIVWRSDS